MKQANGTWAYDATGSLFVPDVRIHRLDPGFEARPLRGYAHTQAVVGLQGLAIGYILTADLPALENKS